MNELDFLYFSPQKKASPLAQLFVNNTIPVRFPGISHHPLLIFSLPLPNFTPVFKTKKTNHALHKDTNQYTRSN
ncbi:MAG: hypothetical protein KDC42_02325 [Ignavibacteriae bacterium]|nr:hypothetical protein [Ignavibacteriota bacterium]